MKFSRYAIYYLPPPKAPWAVFGAHWLGWDVQAGCAVAHPDIPGLPLPVEEITRAPRRYGLHATLKPPFALADGIGRDDLENACRDLARRLRPVAPGGMRLTRLGRFLALCPEPARDLSALAGACVRQLDPLRAPMRPKERARRAGASLTPRQRANLMDWGYPYVLEDFRFHITLSGRLPKAALPAVESALGQAMAPLLPPDVELTDLALTGQDSAGRFHLLRRFTLSGHAP